MSQVRPVHHHSHAVGGLCVVVASVAHAIFSICAQARQFETTFVDPYTRGRCTVTFWIGEPVLYHPPHQAKAVFSHIDLISDGFFVVGQSTTGRMIPFRQAQNVLKVKLSLDDVEREVQGSELDAAERLLWRRWVAIVNARNCRKSRVQAPCCGRYKHRYQVEQDSDGNAYCDACWSAVPPCPPTAPEVPETACEATSVAAADVAAGNPHPKAVLSPRVDSVAEPPAKVRRNTRSGTIDYWNNYKGYGYAQFDGEHTLFHAKDCVGVQPTSGDAVTAYVHRRRRDGKLQAFKVMRADAPETVAERLERVHNTLLGSS